MRIPNRISYKEMTQRRDRAQEQITYRLLWVLTALLALAVPLTPFYLSEHSVLTISTSPMPMGDMPDMPDEHPDHASCLRCVLLVVQAPAVVSVKGIEQVFYRSVVPYASPVLQAAVRGLTRARAPPE